MAMDDGPANGVDITTDSVLPLVKLSSQSADRLASVLVDCRRRAELRGTGESLGVVLHLTGIPN